MFHSCCNGAHQKMYHLWYNITRLILQGRKVAHTRPGPSRFSTLVSLSHHEIGCEEALRAVFPLVSELDVQAPGNPMVNSHAVKPHSFLRPRNSSTKAPAGNLTDVRVYRRRRTQTEEIRWWCDSHFVERGRLSEVHCDHLFCGECTLHMPESRDVILL